ncbi:hypothetical protein CAP35_08910 [Chitinophagaceae bacterium IBVUCB1]|nr:hypothetical protein CAP35_08910 [Chitinophagaceae bacterium IBVUCB1]
MDKVKLGKEQLKELKYFIYSRGFREPEVMMEILDHFACKVEDKLTENPLLSLQDAIKEAHKEFGYNGFYSIKASLDVFTRRRYKRIYWQEVKKILLSPINLLILLLIGLCVYHSMKWAYNNGFYDSYFNRNIVSSLIILIVVCTELIKFIMLPRNNGRSYHISIANTVNYGNFFLFWFFFPSRKLHSVNEILVISIIAVLCSVYYYITTLAHYKMIKAAHKDYDDFKVLVENENPLQ